MGKNRKVGDIMNLIETLGNLISLECNDPSTCRDNTLRLLNIKLNKPPNLFSLPKREKNLEFEFTSLIDILNLKNKGEVLDG